jgi:hypothetical protein
MKNYLRRLLPFVFVVSLTGAAHASMLGVPTGPVVLTVSGSISQKNDGEVANFDRAMLTEMDWKTLETFTKWTDGPTEFAGVDLADLLDAVGAKGTKILASALNDYLVEIPMSDLETNNVFLALEMNGEVMKIRAKGPIWVIYPQAEGMEPTSELNDKMIWQLRSLEIRD